MLGISAMPQATWPPLRESASGSVIQSGRTIPYHSGAMGVVPIIRITAKNACTDMERRSSSSRPQ